MIAAVLSFQVNRIKSNLFTFLLIVITSLVAVYTGYQHGTIKQAVVYLVVMGLCAFVTDLYVLWKPVGANFIVRNPKLESMCFGLSIVLGMLFFFFRFSGIVNWAHINGFAKLAIMPLILFVFPIGLAIIMLLLKYKPTELGLRWHGVLLVIPIVGICFITNRIFTPASFTWDTVMAESGGLVATLFTGLITAGLSEEFFRVIGQTRLGALFQNKGMGWFVTSLIWAFMHGPKWYSEDHNLFEMSLSCLRIVPIGLMWGYITHRTKSFLPATIIHGLNFWGLQNF